MVTTDPGSPARGRRELVCVSILAAVFVCFTWRGLTMFFSGDDMMNMYIAWTTPVRNIWKAQLLPWMPLYRPLGTAVYRVFYSAFGFHPLPLYIFCWLLLVVNVFAAWRFFRALAPSVLEALLALSLILVHGSFDSLYLSAGTIYDRLCFLFTVLAVIVYARVRRDENVISAGRVALICFLCLMAMNSKESGAAVPAILFCYECVYCLPRVWRRRRLQKWLLSIAPLYLLLGAMLAAFVLGRVHGTAALAGSSDYQPQLRLSIWLAHVAEYLDILLYHFGHPTARMTAVALLAMLALAALLRSRSMVFGWLFFVLAITPVATLPMRGGFVLYVPEAGLGLYFAGVIGVLARPVLLRARAATPDNLALPQLAILAVVTGLVVWIHATHWPAAWDVKDSPEWRLTDKMRRDYPTLKPGTKILFVDDYFPFASYDAMSNVRLLYRDISINVSRLHAPPDQQPDRSRPLDFDLVFTTALDTYIELDNRNVEESIKFNILRDYPPGRHFDTDLRSRVGYFVSGVLVSSQLSGGLWTTRSAKLRFDVYPADSTLALKFWVPHTVASGKVRTLSVLVDGSLVGTALLTHEGMNELSFSVPARAINATGFTILQLDVDDPYMEGSQDFGVVILKAGFDYVKLKSVR
jgi:hypothetical protein